MLVLKNCEGDVMAVTGTAERKSQILILVFGLAFGLFCFWLILSNTTFGLGVEAQIRNWLPDWIVVCNLFMGPVITLVAAGPWRIPLALRVVFGVFMFCSILLFEVSFRRYSLASGAVLALLLSEVYWVIPKWDAKRHGKDGETR
jgi:hypothetical protein